MKTKIVLIGILAILMYGCTPVEYLSTSDQIDVNPYGSRIIIQRTAGPAIKGELISIAGSNLIVLKDIDSNKRSERTTVTIPINEIKSYSVQYAKSKSYWWSIPVFTLATIAHGWWLIITAPVNLLVTGIVTTTGATDFQYKSQNMTYEELKKFARFPQGIPENIDITSIK
jgi:hypothetical protein